MEGSEAPLVGGVDDGGVPGRDGHEDRRDEEDEDVLDEKSSDIEVAVGAGVVEGDEAALVLGVHVSTLGKRRWRG